MTALILQFGISNLLLSLALAIVAYAVHRTGKLPVAAHLLWVLVLLKLVTPTIFTVPVVPVPGLNAGTAETITDLSGSGAMSAGALDPRMEALGSNAAAAWAVGRGGMIFG